MKRIIVFALLIACARGNTGSTGETGAPGIPAPTPSPETTIQELVDSQNEYRESLGQTELSLGLSCTVQAISSGGFLSTASPNYVAANCTAAPLSGACAIVTTGPSYSYLMAGDLNQPNSGPGPNSLIDPEIQPLFLNNNYKITCTGQIVVTEDGYHDYTVSSDDGSILTINGTQVVTDDGQHGVTEAQGTTNLRAGVYPITILYSQSGGGDFAYVATQDGLLITAANLYH
jgi:PA14 domain